jgi:hypothetical protein
MLTRIEGFISHPSGSGAPRPHLVEVGRHRTNKPSFMCSHRPAFGVLEPPPAARVVLALFVCVRCCHRRPTPVRARKYGSLAVVFPGRRFPWVCLQPVRLCCSHSRAESSHGGSPWLPLRRRSPLSFRYMRRRVSRRDVPLGEEKAPPVAGLNSKSPLCCHRCCQREIAQWMA